MTNRRIKICLKELLQELDMSQAELARKAEIREAVVSQMVNNRYRRLELSHIECIMRALDINDFNLLLKIVWIEEGSQ